MKIIKNISENIDKYISIVLSLIIPLATWFFYKYSIKHKYKSLSLSNNITRMLKDMIIAILFFPIMTIFHQIFIIILSNKIFDIENLMASNALFLAQLVIALPILILIFKIVKDYTGESKRLNKKEVKGIKALAPYIGGFAIGLVSIISSVILLGISYFIIISNLSNEEWIELIPLYLQAMVLWLFAIGGIYYSIKVGLVISIKKINIHYSKDGTKEVASNIKYENFTIDKNFISFYRENSKIVSVIPADSLIKLEYIYEDSIYIFGEVVLKK